MDDMGTIVCRYIQKSVITKDLSYQIEIPSALAIVAENLSY